MMHPFPPSIPLEEIRLIANAIRSGAYKDDRVCLLHAAWAVAGYALKVTVGEHDHQTGFGGLYGETDDGLFPSFMTRDEALEELGRWTEPNSGFSADGDDARPPELAVGTLLKIACWILYRLAR
jgi:hypothetical protein